MRHIGYVVCEQAKASSLAEDLEAVGVTPDSAAIVAATIEADRVCAYVGVEPAPGDIRTLFAPEGASDRPRQWEGDERGHWFTRNLIAFRVQHDADH